MSRREECNDARDDGRDGRDDAVEPVENVTAGVEGPLELLKVSLLGVKTIP